MLSLNSGEVLLLVLHYFSPQTCSSPETSFSLAEWQTARLMPGPVLVDSTFYNGFDNDEEDSKRWK